MFGIVLTCIIGWWPFFFLRRREEKKSERNKKKNRCVSEKGIVKLLLLEVYWKL